MALSVASSDTAERGHVPRGHLGDQGDKVLRHMLLNVTIFHMAISARERSGLLRQALLHPRLMIVISFDATSSACEKGRQWMHALGMLHMSCDWHDCQYDQLHCGHLSVRNWMAERASNDAD